MGDVEESLGLTDHREPDGSHGENASGHQAEYDVLHCTAFRALTEECVECALGWAATGVAAHLTG